jgi:trimeric autotransporter adhesin
MANETKLRNGVLLGSSAQALNSVQTTVRATTAALNTAIPTELAVANALSAMTLDGLSDVTLSTPTSGQILIKGAGDWANQTVTGDGAIDASGALTVSKIGGQTISLAGTFTTIGAYPLTLNATTSTDIILPSTGTVATLAGVEDLTNKTLNGLSFVENATGFEITGGSSTEKTLTVTADATIDQDLATTASPSFSGLTVSTLTGKFVTNSGSGVISSQDKIGFSDLLSTDIETTLTGNASHLATADAIKTYVDDRINVGISYRPPVEVVLNSDSVSLPTTSATQIDEHTVVTNDRVLVVDSATAGQDNKIYKATVDGEGNITWAVQQDYTGADLPSDGHTVWVKAGTAYMDTRWTFNSTAWVQTGGQGTYTAGNGISINGSVISAKLDGTNIIFSGSNISTVQNITSSSSPIFANLTIGAANGEIIDTYVTGGISLGQTDIGTQPLGKGTALGTTFSATSIVGALNELKGSASFVIWNWCKMGICSNKHI